MLAHWKDVHTDPGPVAPPAECSLCYTRWTPATGSYDLR